MHIKHIHIQNFKSIKDLQLSAKRVNIFIGEPNTGKTNILEALSVFSINFTTGESFKNLIRFKSIRNLFYDSVIDNPVQIITDFYQFKLEYKKNQLGALMNIFSAFFCVKGEDSKDIKSKKRFGFDMEHDGKIKNTEGDIFNSNIMTYIYKQLDNFTQTFRPFLNPPFGDNIPNLLLSISELKKMVSTFFREKNYRINLKPEDNNIEIAKEEDEIIYSYPYITISQTLQRIIFMMLAIESNKNSTLIFDEPESNTFPFYTKYIAERIAQDKTNQYFITTHNPYLLMNIIEKTPSKELNVFATALKNYKTEIYALTNEQLKEVMRLQYDVFLNLDKFIK